MSSNTTGQDGSSSTSAPPTSSSASSSPPPTSSSSPPPTSSSSSSSPPPTSSSSSSSSSTTPPTSSSTSSTPSSSSTTPPPTSSTPPPTSHTSTFTVHSTSTAPPVSSPSSDSSSTTSSAISSPTNKPASHGLSQGGTIAVAVVVPIVAVALILVGLLFLWRKRKARKEAEELRRKEVEEYGYNPNNDPTLPAVGGSDGGAYEMREEGSSGYRGWGATAVASSGHKASTTHSSGPIGLAYSDTSPSRGPVSDTRSDNALMGEAEGMGAMGPAAAGNRGDIHRGPSNASSSYSAANRSDGSGEVPTGAAYYSSQYDTGNPYGDAQYGGNQGGRAEMGGQPVIRDVEARRNTRIENPAHFPQQSAGISQNF